MLQAEGTARTENKRGHRRSNERRDRAGLRSGGELADRALKFTGRGWLSS